MELAFEAQRCWDIRRWKDLAQSEEIFGVSIIKDETKLEYTKIIVDKRDVNDRLYFYPIANSQLFINHNLIQNPGWN